MIFFNKYNRNNSFYKTILLRYNTIMVDNNVTDETGHNTGDSWYYLYRIY